MLNTILYNRVGFVCFAEEGGAEHGDAAEHLQLRHLHQDADDDASHRRAHSLPQDGEDHRAQQPGVRHAVPGRQPLLLPGQHDEGSERTRLLRHPQSMRQGASTLEHTDCGFVSSPLCV